MRRTLHVLQDGLRLSLGEMAAMHSFVCNGGVFNEESLRKHNPLRHSLIALTETDDGELWIRDGYHRIYILSYYGRPLQQDEYFIEKRTYDEFQTINLDRTWVTPFDPRKEIRRSNFFDFKQEAMRMVSEGKDPTEFILQNRSRYCVARDGQADFEMELL